ncbi:outer membrane protein assembly factor BamD [Dongshaea marina]|uniref:outer membrane protein assembly factor BamD n=1 Tax=Dongshaea marina TaxID=2047966 RepID=UPI000D3EA876|nr:outer membrane protein assembly factor BamD [Dongshaea marina]
MGNKLRLLLITALVAFVVTGCSSTKKVIADKSPDILYQEAQQQLKDGDFAGAIDVLEALDSRYPFGAYSKQVQLELIYAYYKKGDTAQALANIDRFIRLNPTDPSIDYVYYMRGLTDMAADSNFLQDLFNMDRFDRDPAYSRQAFADFKLLLTQYPNSRYAADARARMIFLKDRLARYDLAVADYYFRRGAFVAAANRGKQVVKLYPDTPQLKPALEIMIKSYQKLGMSDLEKDAQKVLQDNSRS